MQATQLPWPSQTTPLQVLPAGTNPLSTHTFRPVLQTVLAVRHVLLAGQLTPAVHAPHMPSWHTDGGDHDSPPASPSGFLLVGTHERTPVLEHEVTPSWQESTTHAPPGMQLTPQVPNDVQK